VYNLQVVMKQFAFTDTPWGNPYQALMPDPMHCIAQGMWKHICDGIKSQIGLKKRTRMDK